MARHATEARSVIRIAPVIAMEVRRFGDLRRVMLRRVAIEFHADTSRRRDGQLRALQFKGTFAVLIK